MQSKATTVEEYIDQLPADRREMIEAVRKVILKNLDKDFEEGMQYGMIGYYVPHSIFPDGYHCDPRQPLPFCALASQKNYVSIYLMTVYGEGSHWKQFTEAWAKTGKKLDMGKCCIRFRKLEDVALDVIGDEIQSTTAKMYVARYLTLRPVKSPSNKTTKSGVTTKVASKSKKTASAGTKKVAANARKPSLQKRRKKRPKRSRANKYNGYFGLLD